MIYLLHDFGGSINDKSIQTLITYIHSYSGINICPISYPYINPKETHNNIKSFVDNDNNDKIFIGIGLGGFWARYFANQYSNSKLIMINPILNVVSPFAEYQINNDNNDIDITVIVSKDDIDVDPTPTIKQYKNINNLFITTGGHYLNLYPTWINIINNAINDM